MGSARSIWKFAVSVLVCATLIGMQNAASAADLLSNGSFEAGVAPWSFYINNGAGSFIQTTRTAAPNSGTATGRLRVTQSAGNIWDLGVVQQDLAVSGGQKYSVTFYAKASSSGQQLMVSISQRYSPWGQYYMQTFSLTTSWQQYSFTFTQSASDTEAELVFASGAQAGSVSLDAVSLNALIAPALAVSPASPNFGSLAVGSSSAVQTLTMNSGTANLVMSAVALNGDFKWGPATPTKRVMGASYAPESSCTVAIYFAPQSAGNLMGTLTVTNTADSSARVIAFSGTGISVAPPPAPPVHVQAAAPAPSPIGGLITNFTPTRYNQFQVDGMSHDVLTVGKSYSLQQIDNHTVRFEIRQGDSIWCCNNETAELKRVPKWDPATPVTIEYQFMLEPGAANTANWFVTAEMQSTHATTLGVSPAFAISLSGEHLFVEGRYSPPGGNPANGSPNLTYMSLWKQPTNIVRGQWYDIKIKANVINSSAGYLYVWINGTQVVNYHGMLGYGGDQNYWLYGLYRATSPQVTAGQFRNMTVSP